MAVFGFDLGTTYSSIAYLDATGRATVVVGRDGVDSTCSAVYFESADSVVVGAKAKDTAVLEPDLVVDFVKREIGKHLTLRMHGQSFTAEEVSALILRRLIADAEAAVGHPVTDGVITVPAYFGIGEREATRRAGEIAGLNVIDVLSEPVAAAISYGAFDGAAEPVDQDKTILVYDLGGGTFDTTVVRLVGDSIHEISTGGDNELGGIDWDERLAEYMVEQFCAEHPDVPHPFDDPATVQDIRTQAENAKIRLTGSDSHVVRLVHAGRVSTVTITREHFEELTVDLLDRTIEVTAGVLESAQQRGVADVDQVLLVGGASKMPAVAARLRTELERDPLLHDPDLAVARGAAWYAFEETYRQRVSAGDVDGARVMARQAGLSEARERRIARRRISRVAARALGVLCSDGGLGDEYVMHLIEGSDALPADAIRTFYTSIESQTEVLVPIMEQAGRVQSPALDANREIAIGQIAIPPNQPIGTPVEVTFRLAANGLLQVTAADEETKEKLDLAIQIGGMSDADVARCRERVGTIKVN